jgi:hypothetical protein
VQVAQEKNPSISAGRSFPDNEAGKDGCLSNDKHVNV